MKKKGFTLIELLAVILVIGIISVIAVPVVTNLLKSSRRNAFKTKIYEIEKAAELYYEEELVAKDDSRTYLDLSKTSDKDKLDLKVDIKAGYVDIKENGEIDITALDGEFCGRKSSKEKLVNLLSLDDLYCVLADSNNSSNVNAAQILEEFEGLKTRVSTLEEENSTLKNRVKTLEDNEVSTSEIETLNTIINSKTSLNEVYPVGSIYITMTENTATKVHDKFGGTWVAFGQGRTLIGVGTGTDTNSTSTTFSANDTGGKYNHTLTTAQLPSHTHGIPALSGTATGGNHRHSQDGPNWYASAGAASNTNNGFGLFRIDSTNYGTTGYSGDLSLSVTTNASTSNATGSGNSFSLLQPYTTVYMWKRTA